MANIFEKMVFPRRELFWVIDAKGHKYTVFTDSSIEGFGKGCKISTSYPLLLQQAIALARKHRRKGG